MIYQKCISLINQLDQDDKQRLVQWLIKQIVLNEEINDRQTVINPSTGLCGLWQDSRSSEEVVQEIIKSRSHSRDTHL
jgi:hypothetical protein